MISVSLVEDKSSVLRELYEKERLSCREIGDRLGLSPAQVYRLMRRFSIPRRKGSEQNHATYRTKPQFVLRGELGVEEESLRVAGIMLYWVEGAKTGKTVDLGNSDTKLVALFLAFLRNVCGVAEARLRVLLYAYADQDIQALKEHWVAVTGIPSEQFTKPFVRKPTPNATQRTMPWGLVHIRYNDTRLLRLILNWIDEYSQFWAGTKAAKWSCL